MKRFMKEATRSRSELTGKNNLFLLIVFLCFSLITPYGISANDEISTPGGTIPLEQQGPKKRIKKAPLPSQLFGLSVDPAKILHLPLLDVDALIAEDRAAGKGRPLRAGVHREIGASPETHGEWFEIEGRGFVWLFKIHASSAAGIDIHFTKFHLPARAQVFVYSPSNPDKYDGPYKGGGKGGDFWSGIVEGEEVIVELFISTPYVPGTPPFLIEGISHMYRPLRQR